MSTEYLALAPEAGLALISLVLFGLILARPRQAVSLAWLPQAGLALTGLCVLALDSRGVYFNGAYQADACSQFFKLAVCAGFCIASANAQGRPLLDPAKRSEYFFLLSLSAFGFATLSGAVEIITMFVALELASYSLFALVPLRAQDPAAAEAGIKYILFGAAATALSLYGYAFILASRHSGFLGVLAGQGGFSLSSNPAALLGLGLVLAALLYKLALFPFHAWAPDVYCGADNETAAYLATIPKLGAAVVLMRLTVLAAPQMDLGPLLAALAAASMCVGNLAALAQRDLKRMLGYSGVAHAGYLCVGLVSGTPDGLAAAAYYALVYVVANLAAFWVICRLAPDGRNLVYADLNGLARKSPGLALLLAAAAFSLVGLPPTGGFMGKLFLLGSAYAAGYAWLVVLAVINTAISAYFYLNMVRRAYAGDPAAESGKFRARSLTGPCLAGAILLLGIIPDPIFNLALAAGRGLMR